MVNRVVKALAGGSKSQTGQQWLAAVARRVVSARPDLAEELHEVLKIEAGQTDVLKDLTIGEIGVCYEALVSQMDTDNRRSAGQFFTPDDAARFMAERSEGFEDGVWLDPCCGVGNLAWHLASVHEDPAAFVRNRLVLMDLDDTALRTAIALIAADYVAEGDHEAVRTLASRAVRRDFLARKPLPEHDFAILNPPYARAPRRPEFETAACHDLFAYFMERVAKESRGFIAVTPASYLSSPKFRILRDVLDRNCSGGDVLVYDNVPDTLFRGYKFGSNNTSKTNFVRAAITVCAPGAKEWRTTPIIRWQAASRAQMFGQCLDLLTPRRIGPDGEWAKIGPGMGAVWDSLSKERLSLRDLVVSEKTEYPLEVATTPRYFISAAFRTLDRGSKAVLYFRTASDRDRAALVLNSSIPYIWWRALDGGVTLPRRVLLSVPIPAFPENGRALVERLKASENQSIVAKLNAGRWNENVKHPHSLVKELNAALLPREGMEGLGLVYASNMFQAD